MPGYAPGLLDEIRASTDIVELVGRFVNLRKAGASWKGLCPFHSEKTPSFTVNPARGIFHCFGCGAGGDAFGFLMRQDRLSFPEAVRTLARGAGIPLDDHRGQAGDSGREGLYEAMNLAAAFFTEALWSAAGARARSYLERRGIEHEVARRFGLGWAHDAWDALLGHARASGLGPETLEAAGLVVPRQGGGVYDRFRGRLVFPIRDLQGRVVAFGGRALGDEQPKYLNSPETPLYTKGHLLYAADLARPAIQARNRALLVEGYVDCIVAHQHGFSETVAALGTAFTATQLGLLRRYTSEVVTFFDADAAGEKAAERAAELLEPSAAGVVWGINRAGSLDAGQLRVRVALLPPGHDPDTFLRAEGAAAFEARMAEARGLLSWALERAMADPEGGTGPRARANAFARAALLLARVADADEAVALSREAGLRLGVDAAQLWIEAQKLQTAFRRPASLPTAGPGTPAPPAVERDLVTLLLHVPEARAALLTLLADEDLTHAPLRGIVAALRRRPGATAESLLPDVPDDAARGTLAGLLVESPDTATLRASVEQFQRRLERRQGLRRLRTLTQGVAEAQAAGTTTSVDETFRTLQQEGRAMYDHARSTQE